MKFILLGSGGASKFPRPTCFCKLCEKARNLGIPYARTGPSLYLYDEAILFDTAEEAGEQLNRERIKSIRHVFYTHWHPDHTQGMRIFEHIGAPDRGAEGEDLNPRRPIKVYFPIDVLPDFKKYSSNFFYFEKMGWIKIKTILDRKGVKIGKIKIVPLNLGRGKKRVRYAYLITKNGKRVVYAPCSICNMKTDKYYSNLNLLFIETGWFGKTKEIRTKLPKDHVWQDHISFEENLAFIEKIRPRKTILMHFEGTRHVDYDKIKKQIKPYAQRFNLEVAYDGMIFNA